MTIQKKIDFYNENGFVIFENIIPTTLIHRSLNGVKAVIKGRYNTGISPWSRVSIGEADKINRVAQIHLANTDILKLLTYYKIGPLAAQLTGASKINIWGSQLYYKPKGSGVGGVVGYHRDSEHIKFLGTKVLTVWIPLNDVNFHSGSISYVQGSHLWKNEFINSGAQIQDLDSQKKAMILEQSLEHPENNWTEVTVDASIGSISFHHNDCIHSSGLNITDEDRYAIAFGLYTNELQIDSKHENYGYADIIGNEMFCPTIFP